MAGLPLEVHPYHPLSIIGQPHSGTPPLRELLQIACLKASVLVGIAGWKTADPRVLPEPTVPCFVPPIVVQIIDAVTGTASIDVTSTSINHRSGLRNANSAAQIAYFDWGAARSSAAVLRVVTAHGLGDDRTRRRGAPGYSW